MVKVSLSIENIGVNLRTLIEKKGLKFKSVASDAGISLSHLNKIMSGDNKPSLDVIRNLARVIGASEAELIGEAHAAEIEKRVGDMTVKEFLTEVWGMPKAPSASTKRLVDIALKLPPHLSLSLLQVAESLLAQAQPSRVQPSSRKTKGT